VEVDLKFTVDYVSGETIVVTIDKRRKGRGKEIERKSDKDLAAYSRREGL